jgi:hypothetical protein
MLHACNHATINWLPMSPCYISISLSCCESFRYGLASVGENLRPVQTKKASVASWSATSATHKLR